MINTYEKNQILNNIFRNGEKTIYIGVSKTAPSEDGTNCTEPTVPSYKRFVAKCDATNWNESVQGSTTNSVVFLMTSFLHFVRTILYNTDLS